MMKTTIGDIRSLIRENMVQRRRLSDVKKGSVVSYTSAFLNGAKQKPGSFVVINVTNKVDYKTQWLVDVKGTLDGPLKHYFYKKDGLIVTEPKSLSFFTEFDMSNVTPGQEVILKGKGFDDVLLMFIKKYRDQFSMIEVKVDKGQYVKIYDDVAKGTSLFENGRVLSVLIGDTMLSNDPQLHKLHKNKQKAKPFMEAWDEYHYEISDGEGDDDELIDHMQANGWTLVGTIEQVGIKGLLKGDVVTENDQNEFYRFVLGDGMIQTLGGRGEESITSKSLNLDDHVWRKA